MVENVLLEITGFSYRGVVTAVRVQLCMQASTSASTPAHYTSLCTAQVNKPMQGAIKTPGYVLKCKGIGAIHQHRGNIMIWVRTDYK